MSMKQMQLIVLMGGRATRLAPLSYTLPKGLLPINQKPVIFNMLADYVKQGLEDIVFVVSPGNEQVVRSFVEKSFENLRVRYVVQEKPRGPLHAFQLCEPLIQKPTLLLLGDTYCETDLDYSFDFLGYKTIDDRSHSRWCLIKTDSEERILEIIDKPNYTPETNKVLIGLYNFRDPDLLKRCLKQNYPLHRGELQLSSMIAEYAKQREMRGVPINAWLDTGTLKDYNNTLAKTVSGRNFNHFRLDEFGVLTKRSAGRKLAAEIAWLKEMQKTDLCFLTPRVLESGEENGEYFYRVEYLSADTLAEYFNYYDISEENWAYIFEKLLKTASLMWEKKAPAGSPDIAGLCDYMYREKTLERIAGWNRKDILEKESIVANGHRLLGFYPVFERLKDKIARLCETAEKFYSVIHGDLCFANTIYFPQTNTFKFLDPRGNFGTDMLYGDNRYDVAKLRHNYHGLYDYITQDMFRLDERGPDNFEYSFFTGKMINPQLFDAMAARYGFDVDEIELIEGLLFISMITLHNDDPAAQIMYYITGLKCLNHQLADEAEYRGA